MTSVTKPEYKDNCTVNFPIIVSIKAMDEYIKDMESLHLLYPTKSTEAALHIFKLLRRKAIAEKELTKKGLDIRGNLDTFWNTDF